MTYAIIALAVFCITFYLLFQGKDEEQAEDRPDLGYEVYTTDFDILCRSRDLPEILEVPIPSPASTSLTVRDLADRVALAQLEFTECQQRLAEEPHPIASNSKTNIAFLVDLSGSLGDRIVTIVAQLRALTEWLSGNGIGVCVLGFTTHEWRGGEPRRLWKRNGSPPYPGRLCSLLHIVVKPFEEDAEEQDWEALLLPHLLKENVDGEALQWARDYTAENDKDCAAIVVISDGAPVDDSTIFANGSGFLCRHWREAVRQIADDPTLRLGAVGIEYAVEEVYPFSRRAASVSDLADSVISLLPELYPAPGKSTKPS